MDEPIVEEVITENLPQPLEILEKPPDIVENVVAKKGGRPKGSKDSVKRVVKSRKITIVETPLHAEDMPVATVADPVDPVVMKAPRSRAVVVNTEPEIRYVDRYIEHSPRSLVRLAHGHMENEQNSRRNARREHYENQIIGRLR